MMSGYDDLAKNPTVRLGLGKRIHAKNCVILMFSSTCICCALRNNSVSCRELVSMVPIQ